MKKYLTLEKLISELKKGNTIYTDNNEGSYKMVNGMIVYNGENIIINKQFSFIENKFYVEVKEKPTILGKIFTTSPRRAPAKINKNIKLGTGKVFLCENGKRGFVVAINKKMAICFVEGSIYKRKYTLDGKAIRKGSLGYNIISILDCQ